MLSALDENPALTPVPASLILLKLVVVWNATTPGTLGATAPAARAASWSRSCVRTSADAAPAFAADELDWGEE